MTAPTDKLTRILRFSFGALVGFFVGSIAAVKLADSFGSALLVGAITGIVFGLLAMRFGNDFWESVWAWMWFS